jgi:transposase
MKPPIYVRKLTKREKKAMQAGMRSKDPFVIRRSQIVLASGRGEKAIVIAKTLGCDDETVRNVIKGFNRSGIGILKEGSRRPHTTQAAFSSEKVEQLKEMLHQSPRNFGKATSLWTLGLAAEVSYENGLVAERVSSETIRATLKRFGMKWTRAKHWITSPDPNYERKKTTKPLDKNGRISARLGVFLSR